MKLQFCCTFRFVELKNKTDLKQRNETDYIEIDFDSISCRSQVGRRGGKQKLRAGGCIDPQGNFSYGMVIHELMHSLGKYSTAKF